MSSKMKTGVLLSLAAVGFGFTGSRVRADIVTDGHFIAPPAGSFLTSPPPPAGWTVGMGSVDTIGSYWHPAPDDHTPGAQSVDMDGNSPGALGQSLTGIQSGKNYVLTYYVSGNPDGGDPTKTLEADIVPGATGYTPVSPSTTDLHEITTFNTTGSSKPNLQWDKEVFQFTATSATEYLQFTSLDAGGSPYGPVLSDVSIVPVPVPAAAGLGFSMLGGFAGLAGLRRTLRRKSRIE